MTLPVMALLDKTQMIAIISPVLTLVLLWLLRYATNEIKAAINANNEKVLAKVESLDTKVVKAVGQIEKHDEKLQQHDVAIARLEGAQEERSRLSAAANAAAALVKPKDEGTHAP